MYNCKRRILLLLIGILVLTGVVKAETVSRKEAQGIAELFFNAARGHKMAPPNFSFTGREFTTNHLFIPFYVFNHPTGGFIIISAENKAFPILAYSLRGKYEPGKLTEGQKALLNLYGRHIEFIRYQSDTPVAAIEAWGNIQQHIADILHSQLDVTDLLVSTEDMESEISRLTERADSRNLQSINYTPEQWGALIGEELMKSRNTIMAVIDNKGDLQPAVATGRQGDYFRLRFSDQYSDVMYRLFPTEFLSNGEFAILSNAPDVPDEAEGEEEPFSFYDSFISDINKINSSQRASIEEYMEPTGPVVDWYGSGRFSIYLPENVEQTILYNVAGMRVGEHTYRDTNMADIDLSVLPSGFYIALLRGKSGQTYSVRLYR